MMVPQATGSGACQRGRSSSVASRHRQPVVITVIQKARVKVGAGMRVRRSSWVPNAQLAAASSISATPVGLPPSLSISFHSKSKTPPAAAATPSQARAGRRSLKNSAPNAAEKIGMV